MEIKGEKKGLEEILMKVSGYSADHGHGHYHHSAVEAGELFENEILQEDKLRLQRELKETEEDKERMEKDLQEINKRLK